MENGLREDTSFVYYKNDGKLFAVKLWKNGLLNGKTTFYYTNGKIESEGNYVDSLRTGEWLFYDSLGNFLDRDDFFILDKHSYLNKIWREDTSGLRFSDLKCFYYDIVPKIHEVNGADTVFDFYIYVKCHYLDSVKVIYGDLGPSFKDLSKGKVLYSSNNCFIIPEIKTKDIYKINGVVETYSHVILKNGDAGTRLMLSYFYLSKKSYDISY